MSITSGVRGDVEIFSGSAHPELAREIADCAGLEMGSLTIERFPDGEIYVRVDTSVRGKDVFLVQPTCPPVNENFTELLIILDALYRASAGRITAVIPYYGYARQDKKTAGREPITARMIADVLSTGGVNRVLTIDLHSAQIQGFFDVPVDHLTAVGILSKWLLENVDLGDAVLVAPDAGRVNMATQYADRLGLPVVIIHKRRIGPEQTEVVYVVGDVRGKRPIIIDDMITTGGTVHRSVEALLAQGTVADIKVAVTHPVLVGKALEYLSNPAISHVVVTDTIPVGKKRLPKMDIVSVAPLLADAIGRIHSDSSVSELFLRAA